MELEESFQGSVDPEVRAYVYSLVSAVYQFLPLNAVANHE